MAPIGLPPQRLDAAKIKAEFLVIAIICVFLVLAAYQIELRKTSEGLPSISNFINQFNLGHENNFAAWFSGMLLAIVGLHAMDGHTLSRSDKPRVAQAWIMIASVLFFLSADEVGSLHERLVGVGHFIGVGTWGLLLPLGAVLGVVLLRAMATLWREGGGHRRQVLILLIGFAMLGSVAVQEFIQHALTWDSARARATRLAVEEGSELFGMLILLYAVMGNSVGLRADRHGTVFEMLTKRRRGLLVTLIIATPLLTLLTVGLQDRGRGRPSDWLAAMAFLAAAGVIIGCWLQDKKGHAALLVAGLLLALSCVCIAVSPDAVFETAVVTTSRRVVLLVSLTIMVLVVYGWSVSFIVSRLGLVILAGVCVGLLAIPDNRGMVFFLTIMLGVTIYGEISRAQLRKSFPDKTSEAL